jgi:hypothetical protein
MTVAEGKGDIEMKSYVCFLMLAAVTLCGVSSAHAAPSFLKVGSWYSLTASPGTPLLPQASSNPTDVSALNVKVIELGSGEWCLVEYDNFTDTKGTAKSVEKRREWLNFAFVVNIRPLPQPNYQKLWPGIAIIPYKGTSQ